MGAPSSAAAGTSIQPGCSGPVSRRTVACDTDKKAVNDATSSSHTPVNPVRWSSHPSPYSAYSSGPLWSNTSRYSTLPLNMALPVVKKMLASIQSLSRYSGEDLLHTSSSAALMHSAHSQSVYRVFTGRSPYKEARPGLRRGVQDCSERNQRAISGTL